jgi:NitT/TauT family transport system substrate-binding protein
MRNFRAALCALAVLGLTAQSSPSLPTVRVGANADDQSKPMLYAVSAGLFTKAGINVEIVPLNGGGGGIAAAVSGGSLEAGKANALALVEAHARGIPFTIIAPGVISGSGDHAVGLIVPTNSPLKTGKDFNGTTVGVDSLATNELITTRAYVDAHGGDSSTIHFVETPGAQALIALDQGRIAAAAILEPVLSQGLASGKARLFAYTYGSIADRFDGADWFTTRDWADAHRDIVRRFAQVMLEANTYVASHEAETNPLLANYAKMDPATLATMKHVERPTYLNPAYLQPLIDAAVRYKLIARRFPAAEMISPYALKAPKTGN